VQIDQNQLTSHVTRAVPLDEVCEATNSSCKTILIDTINWEIHKHQPTSPIKRQVVKIGASIMGDVPKPVWLHTELGTHGSLTVKRASKGN
jgi:hypothetical protein